MYFITFSPKYRTEVHPVLSEIDPDGYVRVTAANRDEAEQRAYAVFSAYFQGILSEDELDPERFPLGELYAV